MLREDLIPHSQQEMEIAELTQDPQNYNSPTQPSEQRGDLLDDIFGSDSETSHPSNLSQNDQLSRQRDFVNLDTPHLRQQHLKAGYRDGIAAAKEKFAQEGFDEGFELGAEVGVVVGEILGELQGLVWHARRREDGAVRVLAWQKLLDRAREDLTLPRVFSSDYFGDDGIWSFEVAGEAEGKTIGFREVALAHPLVRHWMGVLDLIGRNGETSQVAIC